MRIVYVIEKISTIGGLERILISKMNALSEQADIEVCLMTIWHDPLPPAYTLHPDIKIIPLDIYLPPVPYGYILSLPFVVRAFNKSINALCPDVTVYFRAVGSFLSKFSSWRGYRVYESHLSRSHSNHRWLQNIMERNVDTIVCLTHGNAQEFKQCKDIRVIPNFTDMPIPETQPQYCAMRCISIGRLDTIKNHIRMLHIWHEFLQTHPAWELHLYGDGPMRRTIEQEIKRLNISHNVILHGNVTDIAIAYLSASMMVMTSRSEGFPMSIIEAMTHALPVVAFDCPHGPSEIIVDGYNGFLVNYDDDKEMIDRMARLADSKELRRTMGQNAQQSIERYNKENIINMWTNLFRR